MRVMNVLFEVKLPEVQLNSSDRLPIYKMSCQFMKFPAFPSFVCHSMDVAIPMVGIGNASNLLHCQSLRPKLFFIWRNHSLLNKKKLLLKLYNNLFKKMGQILRETNFFQHTWQRLTVDPFRLCNWTFNGMFFLVGRHILEVMHAINVFLYHIKTCNCRFLAFSYQFHVFTRLQFYLFLRIIYEFQKFRIQFLLNFIQCKNDNEIRIYMVWMHL